MSSVANRKKIAPAEAIAPDEVRERVLRTASELFYRNGARAVGVDLIVERAGVAKTSLYRHFRTKDDLIAAFLEREDEEFWQTWSSVAEKHASDARGELDAHMQWIGERLARRNYRGCPQLNVAAEFSQPGHPARAVAAAHKNELRSRLKAIAQRLGVRRPDEVAAQLLLLVNGAFVSSQAIAGDEAVPMLLAASRALVAAGRD
ncbi:MAG: TetR/AcrR family transcriptional regulator [Candidatus Eremiobacteraeota bacterium]|nr:TetR/AcrR family transcriptional regulator [Candidatus Eremiobacteraeota bacterium]